MNEVDVRKMLKEAAQPTQGAWAAKNRVVPSYVSDVINGRRDPSPAILKALGLKRVVSYEPVRKAKP